MDPLRPDMTVGTDSTAITQTRFYLHRIVARRDLINNEREEDQGTGSMTRQKNPQKLHIFRISQLLSRSTNPRTTYFAEEPSSQ